MYTNEYNIELFIEKIETNCYFCKAICKGNRAYEVKIDNNEDFVAACFCCWRNLLDNKVVPDMNCGCNK